MKAQIAYSFFGENEIQSGAASVSRFDQTVTSFGADTDASSTVRLSADSVNEPIRQFKESIPRAKPQAAQKLADFISLDCSAPFDIARRLKAVVQGILDSDYSERLTDAIYLLSVMGTPTLELLTAEIEKKISPDSLESADLRYSLVRAFGRLKNLHRVRSFNQADQIVIVRLGIAEALAEIDSKEARQHLVRMKKDSSEAVRDLVAELLLD